MASKNNTFGLAVKLYIIQKFNLHMSSRLLNFYRNTNTNLLDNSTRQKIDDIFLTKLKSIPVSANLYSDNAPYDFILKNHRETVSIRTSTQRLMKISPRVIGQAGYRVLNDNFETILGRELHNQNDIKDLVIDHIEEIFPTFVEYFLNDAVYTVVINKAKASNDCKYWIFDKSVYLNLVYDKKNFSFTKSKTDWIESNTIKYKKQSIAEVQVHKNRTFKFRFMVNNLLNFLEYTKKTNETLGLTAEKAICDIFNLTYDSTYFQGRTSLSLEAELDSTLKTAFKNLPKPIKYTGNLQGECGGNSKSSFDFVLEDNSTLSLKTNWNKMVCPPEVGQPNPETFSKLFKEYVPIKEEVISKDSFKDLVMSEPEKLLPVYLSYLFDCDYLLWIYKDESGKFQSKVFPKAYGSKFKWDRNKITFTRSRDQWNESNTIKYGDLSIGEFQVQNHRNSLKFRFDFKHLVEIIDKYLQDGYIKEIK